MVLASVVEHEAFVFFKDFSRLISLFVSNTVPSGFEGDIFSHREVANDLSWNENKQALTSNAGFSLLLVRNVER